MKMKNKKKKKVVGTPQKPRLVVYRSLRYIYGQIIDDVNKKVLLSLNNKSKNVPVDLKKAKTKTEASTMLGKTLAKHASEKKIKSVVFDRNGYLYHGRVKAFADGAREGGLKF